MIHRSISRSITCLLGFILVGYLYILKPWNFEWTQNSLHSDNSNGDVKSRYISHTSSDDSSYILDKTGYLYPKGYFDFARPGLAPTVKDMNLKGRHSDEVMPVCKNFTNGAGKHIDKDFDYRIANFNFSQQFKNPCWYGQTKKGETKLRCVPYFYFIGTPKAGSTDLFERISKHPDVTRSGPKERRFFDRDRFYTRRRKHFEYYLSTYAKGSEKIAKSTVNGNYNKLVIGDGSPTYIYNSVHWFRFPGNEGCLEPRITCMSHIHHMNPKAKLILIVRNPINRLYSSYLFNWERNGAARTAEEFHDWVSKALNAYLDCFKKHPFRACLYSLAIDGYTAMTVQGNIYSRLIMDVLKVFPREQLHVIRMEDYSVNMTRHLADVFNFLDLTPLTDQKLAKIAKQRELNKGPSYNRAGPMWPKTRKMLYDFYKPFNEELAYILNDDKYLWHEHL